MIDGDNGNNGNNENNNLKISLNAVLEYGIQYYC